MILSHLVLLIDSDLYYCYVYLIVSILILKLMKILDSSIHLINFTQNLNSELRFLFKTLPPTISLQILFYGWIMDVHVNSKMAVDFSLFFFFFLVGVYKITLTNKILISFSVLFHYHSYYKHHYYSPHSSQTHH